MTPKVSILYVTFSRDLEFFRYSIRSVQKFCSGFAEVVVLVPNQDVQAFKLFNGMVDNYRVFGFDEVPGKGMLHHEALVCSAEKFCEGDFILHMDSDVLFWEETEPRHFFVDGKPVMAREPFENFHNYAARYSWKKCVCDAIGIDPVYEQMIKHPMIHHRFIYKETRDAVEANTKRPFFEYVMSCRNEFPQTFCEFNTLGTIALINHEKDYHWLDIKTNDDGSYTYRHGADKAKAFWSHGGVGDVRHELDIITR